MVKIYTTNLCPYCILAKRLLNEKGIEFEEINIENNGLSRDKLMEITGGRTVPQIVFNGKPICGYENLVILDSKGKLSN